MSLPVNQVVCGDCIEVMQTFPNQSIDLIVTDPPYGVLDLAWDKQLKEVLELDDRFDLLLDKPIFNFEKIKSEGSPYRVVREKQRIYGKTSTLPKFVQSNMGKRNPKTVLEYPIIQGGKEYVGHPTQKPERLIMFLIKASSNENDVVLDPFVGSGTSCVAAQKLGRRWIGIDINPEYVEMAKKRLRRECSQKLTKFFVPPLKDARYIT